MKLFLMNFFAVVVMVMFGMRAFSDDSFSTKFQNETKFGGKDTCVSRGLK